MEQQDHISISFKEIIQKAIIAKAKTGLQSNAIVWDANFCCSRDYCLSINIASKLQTQETTAKKSHS